MSFPSGQTKLVSIEKPFISLFELLNYKKEHCTVLVVFINANV